MIQKEKFHIEQVFDKASKTSLWNHLTSSSGLSEWFADDVSVSGDVYIFTWNKFQMEAKVVALSQNNYVRFKWMEDEDPKVFFEFRLHTIELTGGVMLEIIDFADPSEKEDTISLWESQIKVLKRTLGI